MRKRFPAGKIIESLEEGEFHGVASELTLLELTVRPLQLYVALQSRGSLHAEK